MKADDQKSIWKLLWQELLLLLLSVPPSAVVWPLRSVNIFMG